MGFRPGGADGAFGVGTPFGDAWFAQAAFDLFL